MFREDYSRGDRSSKKKEKEKKTEMEDLFRTRSRILKTRKISRGVGRLKNLPGKGAEKNRVKVEILEKEKRKKS